MRKLFILCFAIFSCVAAQSGEPESRVLMIPLSPIEQKVSERMHECISALKEEGALLALKSWKQIPDLPEWVFVEKKREIAYVFGKLGVSDGYRYAVILGRKKELIIVRAGGIAGSYEIFVRPKTEPNQ